VEDAALGPDVVLLLQMEVPPAETASLVARARARGARTVLNLAPAGPLPGDALRALDLLVVNEHEAAWLAARLGCGADAAALRAALGGGPDVAVTRGEAGAEAATAAGTLRAPTFPVAAIDTTGAGDCWCGVLAAALDAGAPLEKAMLRAAAAAAIACTRPGAAAAMPDAAQVDALLASSP
jgi:ribokinase